MGPLWTPEPQATCASAPSEPRLTWTHFAVTAPPWLSLTLALYQFRKVVAALNQCFTPGAKLGSYQLQCQLPAST
jgi:hypothetical protein